MDGRQTDVETQCKKKSHQKTVDQPGKAHRTSDSQLVLDTVLKYKKLRHLNKTRV